MVLHIEVGHAHEEQLRDLALAWFGSHTDQDVKLAAQACLLNGLYEAHGGTNTVQLWRRAGSGDAKALAQVLRRISKP